MLVGLSIPIYYARRWFAEDYRNTVAVCPSRDSEGNLNPVEIWTLGKNWFERFDHYHGMLVRLNPIFSTKYDRVWHNTRYKPKLSYEDEWISIDGRSLVKPVTVGGRYGNNPKR